MFLLFGAVFSAPWCLLLSVTGQVCITSINPKAASAAFFVLKKQSSRIFGLDGVFAGP